LKSQNTLRAAEAMSFHLLESDSSTGDLGEDLLGGGSPDECFRVVVVSFQVVLDRGDEVIYGP
jgi:hypothetical protein